MTQSISSRGYRHSCLTLRDAQGRLEGGLFGAFCASARAGLLAVSATQLPYSFSS